VLFFEGLRCKQATKRIAMMKRQAGQTGNMPERHGKERESIACQLPPE
jgi:hypothetical protein